MPAPREQLSMNRLSGKGREHISLLLDRPDGNIGVELGVAAGDFSEVLLDSGCFKCLYGIDAYDDHHDVDEYKFALKRLGWQNQEKRYTLLRMCFNQALELFEDNILDFVYIDGYAHTGQNGGQTIYDWFRKVKVLGVLSGHDYCSDFPLTMRAVDHLVHRTGLKLHVSDMPGQSPSWAVIKTSDTIIDDVPQSLLRDANRAHQYRMFRSTLGSLIKPMLIKAGFTKR